MGTEEEKVQLPISANVRLAMTRLRSRHTPGGIADVVCLPLSAIFRAMLDQNLFSRAWQVMGDRCTICMHFLNYRGA